MKESAMLIHGMECMADSVLEELLVQEGEMGSTR